MIFNERIVHALFETKALRISPSDQPFFYTSGSIGPYYINTQFLFGSEADANELLGLIETAVKQPLTLTATLWPRIERQYRENPTYRLVIDELVMMAKTLPFDLISGGERRDYFFSLPVSMLVGKPHVSILKSGDAYIYDQMSQQDRLVLPDELSGKMVLHISDLVTEASSYIRAWIPTVSRLGATMSNTLTVVDRDQGGSRILAQAGTILHALTVFSAELLASACYAGLITELQQQQALQFLRDPAAFQRIFLAEHPNYLEEHILRGDKSADRARLLLERLHES